MTEISENNKDDLQLQSNESFTPKHEEIPDLLNSVEELAIFGFWEWNIQTGMVLWSDHLFSMFGRKKEDFKPSFENFLKIVYDKDKEYVKKKVTDAVEQRITLDYIFRGVLPSGEERVFQTWGGIKLDLVGNPHRVVGVVIDNTDKINKQNEIQKLNDQLNLKNKELIDANKLLVKKHDEKEALLKEIHHRIKNNLQIVNSLLRFQASKIDDTRTIGILKDIENRIYAISSLHEKLYQSHDLRHIKIKDHFGQLINELIESCKNNIEIQSKILIDDTKLNTKQLIPLGLILNELITNSLEHGFIGKKEGMIHFYISSNSEKEVKVIIGDNGIGMLSGMDSLRKGSVGIELVKIFVDQLDGSLIRLNNSGTFYELTFRQT